MKTNRLFLNCILALIIGTFLFSCESSTTAKKPVDDHSLNDAIVDLKPQETDTLSANEYFEKATILYEAKAYDSAKVYYQKAARKDHAEAHFILAYNYIVNAEESMFHYSQAAMLGNYKALDRLIDNHFYRANNLYANNVKKIYKVYQKAQEMDSSIGDFELLKKAAMVPELDGEKLAEKYDLSIGKEFHHGYFIWELAEAASRGEKFDNPTPLLVLQLIIKGAFVPAEAEMAIYDYLNFWEQDTLVPFDLCNYVTSGIGINFCSSRAAALENEEYEKEIAAFNELVDLDNKYILYNAFEETIQFIDLKAWNEECHDGSGFEAWTNNSIYEQQRAYLAFVKSLYSKEYVDSVSGSIEENDSLLNIRYQEIAAQLKESHVQGMRFSFSFEDFRLTQRKWIKYRDVNAAFFHELHPGFSIKYWKNYLTLRRIADFESVDEMIEVYK